MLKKTCQHCQTEFSVTNQDEQFYQACDVATPKLCPDCRLRRRLAFRNERTLYQSNCANCHQSIITMYAPEKKFTVFCTACWWSNAHDPLQFGRDFDFSKTLAEQLTDLYRAVPHVALYTTNCLNSDYNNFGLNLNNCYLIFGGSNNENCLYGKFVLNSLDTVDALSAFSNELCYESVASERCYNCHYITNSRDCRDSLMMADCQSCTDCIGCFGLHGKQYYVFNEFVGETEFKRIAATYQPLTVEKVKLLQDRFNQLRKNLPHRASHIYASENCSGDFILNSVNCHDCFDIKESENCRYVSHTPHGKDSFDATFTSPLGVERSYNVCSSMGRELHSTFLVWNCYDVAYSLECHNSHDLLACVGIQKQPFAILNKVYSEAAYKALRAKIIVHLKQTGEWGEYLPAAVSPFGYNETIAQEYFPLTEAEANILGYSWYTIPEKQYHVATAEVLACVNCQKNYRIVKAEREFYLRAKLPTPELCPDCRRSRRIIERGPYHLWTRPCNQCQQEIKTNYSTERAQVVYCENCYQAAVY